MSAYWLNEDSRTFLSRGYLEEGVTAEQRIRKISETAEHYLKIEGFADKFEDYVLKGWFSLASPIWSNFGEKRGLPISCNNTYIPDTVEGILEAASEVGIMTKNGAGTSVYFGDVRPRGSNITGGGTSFGAVHFMQIFDTLVRVISQSNVRRGSCAVYYPVEGADILEFLEVRSEGNPIQDLSIGVTITDQWMQEMKDGDKKKRKIWSKIIEKRFESGYPYIFWTDTVNNNAPKVYKDKELRINSSNLCVSGNQRVVSNYGILTAKELYGLNKPLVLFDNEKSVRSTEMRLIEQNANVYKVTLENGMSHTITEDHKLVVRSSERISSEGKHKTVKIACKDLKPRDLIAFQKNRGVFGTKSMQEEAYLLGQYQANGTQYKESIYLCIWEDDFDLLDEIKRCFDVVYDKYAEEYLSTLSHGKPHFRFNDTGDSKVKKQTLSTPLLPRSLGFAKGKIPNWIWESDEETQWKYVKGLFDADGSCNVTIDREDRPTVHLSIANINREFLQDLQILLSNLGMSFSLGLMKKSGFTPLPDQKGGSKLYPTEDCWRLTCGNKPNALRFEEKTGFLSRKGTTLKDREYRDNTKKFSRIKSIEYAGKEDVYCCSVDSEEHLFVCNGFITSNCSEIALFSDDENSFVCDLSSMNLLHWEEWKDTDAVQILTIFLDAVMSEYIEKTENMPYMYKARNFATNQRAVGVGGLGWHSYLQSKMIPFESLEAKLINVTIWKHIKLESVKASQYLAKHLGEPGLLEGYGMRNVTTMAIAPTTSSSFILGQVSPSIEPLESNYFVKELAKGKFTYKNPYLKDLLRNYKKDTKEVWNSILTHGGSVQQLDFLTDKEKLVFKTFIEISQKEIVIQAAARQRYIDQSQSLNLMIHPETPARDVSTLMLSAWELGVKTLYYQRGQNASQELSRSILNCVSCES